MLGHDPKAWVAHSNGAKCVQKACKISHMKAWKNTLY